MGKPSGVVTRDTPKLELGVGTGGGPKEFCGGRLGMLLLPGLLGGGHGLELFNWPLPPSTLTGWTLFAGSGF